MPRLHVVRWITLCAGSIATLAPIAACRQQPAQSDRGGDSLITRLPPRLPTGVTLDPAAPLSKIGPMPLTMLLAPEGDRVVVSLAGYRQQGVQVIDATSGRVIQELPQAAAFVGLAFSPDGRTLYASGGNQDVVYRYDWSRGAGTLRDSLVLAAKAPRRAGTRYPAGLALSPDGRMLYVAENLADSLAVVDLTTGRVVQRFPTERYPYDVAADRNGAVYVSAWGGYTVSVFSPADWGQLRADGTITVARHPSAMTLNRDGSRLFVASGSTDHVAVIDTKRRQVIARLLDPPPAGPGEGTTPNNLTLSADGTRLFVAEADANSVAVFDLTGKTANVAAARGTDSLSGRIPAGWYPSAVLPVGTSLLVASGKGRGTIPNPNGPGPRTAAAFQGSGGPTYTLALLDGGMMRVPMDQTFGSNLARMTARVTAANGWNDASRRHRYPPFEHVIYVIKEIEPMTRYSATIRVVTEIRR